MEKKKPHLVEATNGTSSHEQPTGWAADQTPSSRISGFRFKAVTGSADGDLVNRLQVEDF
jgi:hypothetical protein